MSSLPLKTYLRTHRRRTGLSQRDVAFLLGGESGTVISRHERGRRMPVLETALAYELIYRVSVRSLYAGACRGVQISLRGRAARLHRELCSQSSSTRRKRKIAVLARIVDELAP